MQALVGRSLGRKASSLAAAMTRSRVRGFQPAAVISAFETVPMLTAARARDVMDGGRWFAPRLRAAQRKIVSVHWQALPRAAGRRCGRDFII